MIPGISPLSSGRIVNAGSITYIRVAPILDYIEYDFVCPVFNTLIVTVIGGSGGGASFNYHNYVSGAYQEPDAAPQFYGTSSRFNENVIGNAGSLGGLGNRIDDTGGMYRAVGLIGIDGSASGGDTNITGGGYNGGNGGSDNLGILGGTGGKSGKAIKTYYAGDLNAGDAYKVKLGRACSGALAGLANGTLPYDFFGSSGLNGQHGSVHIEWT